METSTQPRLPKPRIKQESFLRELINTLIFIVAVFTLLQLAMPRSVVHGSSMEPNFGEGQYLIISRVNYLLGEPERGDIVVFNSPDARSDEPSLIKRVIGLPGETIEIRDTIVHIDGEPLDEPYINEPCTVRKCQDEIWELGPNEYFLMGDNRNVSNDSRSFDAVQRELIIGEVLLRYWPLDRFGIVHQHRFTE